MVGLMKLWFGLKLRRVAIEKKSVVFYSIVWARLSSVAMDQQDSCVRQLWSSLLKLLCATVNNLWKYLVHCSFRVFLCLKLHQQPKWIHDSLFSGILYLKQQRSNNGLAPDFCVLHLDFKVAVCVYTWICGHVLESLIVTVQHYLQGRM